MNALHQAIRIYQRLGVNFAEVHGRYSEHGYVFSTPEKFLMARAAVKRYPEVWLKPGEPLADCWHVEIAIGRGALAWCLRQMPVVLPWVSWARSCKDASQRRRFYRTERVIQLIHEFSEP